MAKKQYTPEELKELRNSYAKIPDLIFISQNEINEKQYQSDLIEFLYKNPSADEKFYINYRIEVLEDVLKEWKQTADFYEREELGGKELIDGNLITTKTGTASDYLAFTKDLDFLKDKFQELSEPKQTEPNNSKENPYPLIFVGANSDVYDKFIEYTKKHIIDFYTDYSYLKKRLEKQKLIHGTKDNEFMGFLFKDLQLINEKAYNDYSEKHESKLKSLPKSYSVQRENNFNIVFEGLI